MKTNAKFLIPVFAVMFFATNTSAQQFPGRDGNDRYEHSRYEYDRYGNNDYRNNWTSVARMKVSRNDGYDRINLNNRYRNIHQLLFRADGPTNIYRVAVRYSDGRTEELRVRNNRRDNRRWNDNYHNELIVSIPNRGRSNVRQIMFWYDNDGYSRSRSIVNVYAR